MVLLPVCIFCRFFHPHRIADFHRCDMISGIPKFGGGYSFTVEVKSGLHYCTQELFLQVHISISVITSSLPDGQVGVAYSETLEALNDSVTYTWSIIAGSLPAGLSLDGSTGEIYGTPTTASTYSFTVQVDDGLKKATQALSIRVQ